MLRQKLHKFKFNGIEKKKNKSIIRQGIIGVKTLNVGKLTKNEVESSRKVITKYTKRNCKI
jgi:ribosomal protein L16/L10AE